MSLEANLEQTEAQGSASAEGNPAQAAASVEANISAPSAGDASAPAQAPAPWTPDFKFKVMDQEHEIEEMYRPLIKDEDTLKKIRRLHEQALGVPHLEASRDEFKNKYTAAAPRLQEYEVVEKNMNRLSHFVKQRDFHSFFDALKIPKTEILNWVKQELTFADLPQEVQNQIMQARQVSAQAYDAQSELQRIQAEQQEQARSQMLQTIDTSIATEAGDVAKAFNERVQDPLAFRNAVITRGSQIMDQTGQKLPVSEVIKIVTQDLTRLMGYQPAAQTPGGPPNVIPPKGAQAGQAPPVIPNLQGSGASPVQKGIKSMKDLLARQKEVS